MPLRCSALRSITALHHTAKTLLRFANAAPQFQVGELIGRKRDHGFLQLPCKMLPRCSFELVMCHCMYPRMFLRLLEATLGFDISILFFRFTGGLF